MKKIKKRYWTFILYPESAPHNWIEILESTGLKIAISPLHDRDIIKETGELKKSHRHVIICFDSPTTFSNIKILTDSLEQPIPKYIDGKEGVYFMHEYLTHSNESAIKEGKAQYDPKEIIYLNGFNLSDYRVLSDSDLLEFKIKILDFIENNDIVEYCDLLLGLKDLDRELFEYASNHTILFDRFVSSRRHKKKVLDL